MFSISFCSKCFHCLLFNPKSKSKIISNRNYQISKLNFLLTLKSYSLFKGKLNNKYLLRLISSNLNSNSSNNNNNKMQQNNNEDDEIQSIDLNSQFNSDFLSLDCNPSTENSNRNTSGQQQAYNSQPTNSNARLDYTEEVNRIRLIVENSRKWTYSNLGTDLINKGQTFSSKKQMIFSLLSYNLLAQKLLEDHLYLYKNNDPRGLNWEHRKQLLFAELRESKADIICLQELQESHMELFNNFFNELNYTGYYKKRTNEKPDGVAIYYKKDKFKLVDMVSVEYNQPGIPILNRDNVGLILRLAPHKMPNQNLVVVTTHLLYNPRRQDVKLAQLQLLFAEIDRIAYKFSDGKHVRLYWPIIFTGDLNFTPESPLYDFITRGNIQFRGLTTTMNKFEGQTICNLLPDKLGITDLCVHEELNNTRKSNQNLNSEQSKKFIKVYNSESDSTGEQPKISYKDYVDKIRKDGLMNQFVPILVNPNKDNTSNPNQYNSGRLVHCFHFRSVYKHHNEVTTFHDRWTSVDYIFYGCFWNRPFQRSIEGKLKLLGKYQLPTESQANEIGAIPNLAVPSDHYPLIATFLLQL